MGVVTDAVPGGALTIAALAIAGLLLFKKRR
jgi:hypothetical protein